MKHYYLLTTGAIVCTEQPITYMKVADQYMACVSKASFSRGIGVEWITVSDIVIPKDSVVLYYH